MRGTTDKSEFHEQVYSAGKIDGVEVTNGYSFYPPIVRRALENKLFMVASSDAHEPISANNIPEDMFRTMTLIFAKENSEKAIKEALKSRRTLGYSGGNLVGEEQLLKDFFNASVKVSLVSEDAKGGRTYALTNNSSIDYTLVRSKVEYRVPALKVTMITLKGNRNRKPAVPKFSVANMWHVDYQHPAIELKCK